MKVLKDIEMKEYSNMKIGGIARELFIIEEENELSILREKKRYFCYRKWNKYPFE